MAYVKNVWTDQDVERPRTYQMSENQDGSVTLIDDFGLVTDLGTPVNADNMNHIEDGIEDCYEDLVNKTGDTMSGNLAIENNSLPSLLITNTSTSNNEYFGVEVKDNNFDISASTAPSANNNSCRLVFRDKSNTASAWIQNRHTAANDMNVTLGMRRTVSGNDVVSQIALGVRPNGTAYCNFPDTFRVDGQWVDSYSSVFSDTSLTASTNLNKTVTLPNDNNIYMVTFRTILTSGTTSGNFIRLSIKSNVIDNPVYACAASTRANASITQIGWVTIPVKYGSNNITITRATTYTGTATLEMLGYRRVGTNA